MSFKQGDLVRMTKAAQERMAAMGCMAVPGDRTGILREIIHVPAYYRPARHEGSCEDTEEEGEPLSFVLVRFNGDGESGSFPGGTYALKTSDIEHAITYTVEYEIINANP